MTIAQYINNLLYRYNCVIVPSFGGFIANKIGAKHNVFTHTFYPPTKQISFNSYLKHNDGLLVNYIAKTKDISFDEAMQLVASTVKKWHLELQNSSVQIASVGVLSLNAEQQIVFEPNLETNFLTTSFGLEELQTPTVKRSIERTPAVVPTANIRKEKTFVGSSIAKYAASAAILLTLGFVGWQGYRQQEAGEIMAKQQQKLEQKIQKATFVMSNPLPIVNLNVKKASSKNYHIIAGAFQFVENAEKKVLQLKNKGFKASVIGKNKWGLTQVAFNSYASRKEALQALRKIKNTVSKEAWLFIK